MQHYTGPIITLTDCERAGRNLMGRCRQCGHMRGFSPYTLRSDLKRDMAIADVARLMRCKWCKRRDVALAYNRNVVEIHMDRIRATPEGRVFLDGAPRGCTAFRQPVDESLLPYRIDRDQAPSRLPR